MLKLIIVDLISFLLYPFLPLLSLWQAFVVFCSLYVLFICGFAVLMKFALLLPCVEQRENTEPGCLCIMTSNRDVLKKGNCENLPGAFEDTLVCI